MTALRPYQEETRKRVNELLNAGRHPLCVAPTGCGKTRLSTAIIADRIKLKRRIFVIVPQEEIFHQWVRELSLAGLNPGTINAGGVRGKGRGVYVCMAQSLCNILPYIPAKLRPHEIVTDEAHHSSAASWKAIYEYYDHALRFGLTATPYRLDNKPLGEFYTDLVESIAPAFAIGAGYLVKPVIIAPEDYVQKIDIPDADAGLAEQARLLGEPAIVGDCIKQYGKIFAGAPVLVACCTYAHAAQVADEFCDAGWRFEHVHGGLSTHERRRLLSGIAHGRLNGLCTVGIGIEGLDIPGLYGLIWMRRTMSLTVYLQFIGRVLRPAAGKKVGVIVDAVGNVFLHGRPELARKWKLDSSYEPSTVPAMKVCPACGVMNALENSTCHVCGADFAEFAKSGAIKPRLLPACIDGELIFLTEAEREAREAQAFVREEKQNPEIEKAITEFLTSTRPLALYKTTLTGLGLGLLSARYAKTSVPYLVNADELRNILKMTLGTFAELSAKGIIEHEDGKYNVVSIINSIICECINTRTTVIKLAKIDMIKSDLTGRKLKTLFSETRKIME